MKYPRVDVFKRTKHTPTYQEFFIVDTMRPNRPKCSKCWKTKLQADAYARRELALLKKEGYEKVVYNSMMIDLSKFIR